MNHRLIAGAAMALVLLGCDRERAPSSRSGRNVEVSKPLRTSHEDATRGRLSARPHAPSRDAVSGKTPLALEPGRDGWLYLPKSYAPARTIPLVVFLHGAGGDAGQGSLLQPLADELGFALLSIDSRGVTWDVIEDDFGPDVTFLDRALAHTFERVNVDRVVVSGFSDGASYALTLGVANGELFESVVAFSPGFMAPKETHGMPRLFLSHGDDDRVLPIDRCSRRLVPKLKNAGYDVRYDEFAGPHAVPPKIAAAGMRWAVKG